MGTPATNEAVTQEKTENSFVDQVNKAVTSMTKDAKGNYVLPDDLPEEVRFAAMSEKRFRDTQSSYTKSQQENKALKAEKAALVNKLQDVEVVLTAEQAEELEELKFSDPEAWRKKMNSLEKEARTKRVAEIDEEIKQVSAKTLGEEEIERRKEVLEQFKADNEGFELSDEILANDIPPRISKKLEKGEISFEVFLEECRDYLKKGKVVKQEETLDQPNMSKVGGGSKPDANAVKEDIVLSYKQETY